ASREACLLVPRSWERQMNRAQPAYSSALLDSLIEMAQKKNILCIADEVFTGFGRTGKLFACDYLSNKPDIIALSKGLTGGTLPLGATLASEKVVEQFKSNELSKTFFHGHSFTANPIACASANASFELLLSQECQQNIQRIALHQKDFAKRLIAHQRVRAVHQLGTVVSLELEDDESSSYANSSRNKIYNYFIGQNILLRPLGNVIYIVPPYIISDKELHLIHSTIMKFLDTIEWETA
ncbi:MAG: aminotransferase class III-fold pyridoxal phosphate-dependent enzyme, partial [Flammeovirgaceae bacterium]|nr:aminotransferase class III-fold pyridoxal phosphate-dependent enzyme [Flammeovirgaceae bacterium]